MLRTAPAQPGLLEGAIESSEELCRELFARPTNITHEAQKYTELDTGFDTPTDARCFKLQFDAVSTDAHLSYQIFNPVNLSTLHVNLRN